MRFSFKKNYNNFSNSMHKLHTFPPVTDEQGRLLSKSSYPLTTCTGDKNCK